MASLKSMKNIYLSAPLVFFSIATSASLQVEFKSETADFDSSKKEYERIWTDEGNRIAQKMEARSGVRFKEDKVKAIVYEGISLSGKGSIPMKLRASYPGDTKKATIVHELGHRLLAEIPTTKEIDEHRKLFLVLYDIWVDLFGKDFADSQVLVEKRRKGRYDYESAWNWALALTPEQRISKFNELKSMR